MAGLFDKAKEALGNESTSDSLLDKAAQAADKATGGKHTDKIRQARDKADEHVGSERTSGTTTDPTANRDRL